MEQIPQQLDPESEEKEKKVFDFILKLSDAPDSNEEEIVQAIVEQLKLLNTSRNLPDILDRLSNGSEKKLLSEEGKIRLEKGLDAYTDLYSK